MHRKQKEALCEGGFERRARDATGECASLNDTLQVRRHHRYTYASYVAIEQDSAIKHEFIDGEIYAMAGGSEEHSALAARVLALFDGALGDGPCRVHVGLRIYVEAVGLATFLDGSVICGELEQHGPSPKTTALNPTALNPTVLLEVTSDSSEDYDTRDKVEYYRTIYVAPRLRHRLAPGA